MNSEAHLWSLGCFIKSVLNVGSNSPGDNVPGDNVPGGNLTGAMFPGARNSRRTVLTIGRRIGVILHVTPHNHVTQHNHVTHAGIYYITLHCCQVLIEV